MLCLIEALKHMCSVSIVPNLIENAAAESVEWATFALFFKAGTQEPGILAGSHEDLARFSQMAVMWVPLLSYCLRGLKSLFFPKSGSSAQKSSGVCQSGSQEQVPDESSGRFRCVLVYFRRQVPDGSGEFRRVPMCAGVGSGGKFRRVPVCAGIGSGGRFRIYIYIYIHTHTHTYIYIDICCCCRGYHQNIFFCWVKRLGVLINRFPCTRLW